MLNKHKKEFHGYPQFSSSVFIVSSEYQSSIIRFYSRYPRFSYVLTCVKESSGSGPGWFSRVQKMNLSIQHSFEQTLCSA